MNIAIDAIYSKMIAQFGLIDNQFQDRLEANYQKACCAKNSLKELEETVEKTAFKDANSEIHYFKYLKPIIESEYIYYEYVTQIIAGFPPGSNRKKKGYFEKHQNGLTRIFQKQSELFNYVRQTLEHKDELIFRCNYQGNNIVAVVTAIEKLDFFLANEKKSLKHNSKVPGIPKPTAKLNWTGTNTDLVELSYALFHSNAINDGAVTITTILSTLQEVFDRPIKDAPRLFQDLKKRKNTTQFLNKLAESLEINIFE